MDAGEALTKASRAVTSGARTARQSVQRLLGRPIWLICWTVAWILILWDVWLALDEPDGNTWSEVMRTASATRPFLPWILGALTAHLFHHRDDLEPILGAGTSMTLMTALTAMAIGLGVAGVELNAGQIALTAGLGMVAGYLLWPKARTAWWRW